MSMSCEQRVGDLVEAHLGVAHRRRRVGIDRAEIALAVDQRQAHGKILRHAHQRVIDRLVAMRMIFADDVADDARGFAIRPVPFVAVLVHRKEDAAMHRLEAVARVRQRPRHDHAHRVIEIAALHLLGDGDGPHIGRGGIARRLIVGICHLEGTGKTSTRPQSALTGRHRPSSEDAGLRPRHACPHRSRA